MLGVKIAQWRQPLSVTRRVPSAKAPIAQGFDRDRHNLWGTTFATNLCVFITTFITASAAKSFGRVPKIVLGAEIGPQRRPLTAARRLPSLKIPIAQAFLCDQHNLQDTINSFREPC